MNSLIQSQKLTKTFLKGSTEVHALDNVSLEISQGEFVSIVGRSGSGKSTLLNLIGGLDTATSGSIQILDKELTHMDRNELALHRRETVGMIFQSFNLIPSRTAVENVTLALAFAGVKRKDRPGAAKKVLGVVGLGDRLDHTPGELSGGEAQRVAIARALVNNPRIILADEPTGNLDSKTSEEILEILVRLNKDQNLTVLMVTHDEASATATSNRLIRLLDGRVIEDKQLRRSA